MASLPILSVLENLHVSPPPPTVSDNTSLAMTFMDIPHILTPPPHTALFFKLPLTKTEFIEAIVPKIKHSLSNTLGHFLPFAGNVIVYNATSTTMPEIRYVKGDYVKVTIAESNLDFNDLTGYHPRNCDKFYHLIPPLGDYVKIDNYVKIPVLSLQVTLFPNSGFSLVLTSHHSLTDASTMSCFMNAWASIAKCGSDESFLANGTLPFFERVLNYPERDKSTLMMTKVEKLFDKEYQPPKLSGPITDKVRGSFVITRSFIDKLKKLVSTKLPTLPHVSSFTVTCAHIWCCLAKAFNEDGQQGFMFPVDVRRRLDPPIPASYVGNCLSDSMSFAKGTLLTGNEGFINAAKLIGENLHKKLTDKDGIIADKGSVEMKFVGWPKKFIVIAGTPKVRYYDLDFGWGKPEKVEIISLDHGFILGVLAISMDGGKHNQDIEIGICLTATQMKTFASVFNKVPETY